MSKNKQRRSQDNFHLEKQPDGALKKVNHFEEHAKAVQRRHVKKQKESHERALERKKQKESI